VTCHGRISYKKWAFVILFILLSPRNGCAGLSKLENLNFKGTFCKKSIAQIKGRMSDSLSG